MAQPFILVLLKIRTKSAELLRGYKDKTTFTTCKRNIKEVCVVYKDVVVAILSLTSRVYYIYFIEYSLEHNICVWRYLFSGDLEFLRVVIVFSSFQILFLALLCSQTLHFVKFLPFFVLVFLHPLTHMASSVVFPRLRSWTRYQFRVKASCRKIFKASCCK